MLVTAQVLSGNLGDGWKDEYEAAVEYAELLKTNIENICQDFDVDVDISRVQIPLYI